MDESATPGGSGWWREKEPWLLVVFLSVALLARITDVPLRGEEAHWGQIGREMCYYGDWVVPRENGEPFLSRPPLHIWMVVGSEAVFGEKSRLGMRFPSVVAIVLTSLFIYAYGRQFMGRKGALAAALAYATCGEVLYTAQLAETEAVYIFFLAGSLLVWHWGYAQGWRPALTWSATYAFAALACLCKGGLQPPVYLAGTVGLYLLWNRNLRYAFSRGHLIGLAVGIAIAAAWAVPCAEKVGWLTTKHIWMSDTSSRFVNWKLGEFLWHLVQLPGDSIPGLFPWGLLALGLAIPDFRRMVAGGPACIPFCLMAFLIAFPSVWIPPGGRTRYLLPLYPCLAVLFGAVVDRVSEVPVVSVAWRRFLVFWSVVLGGSAAAVVASLWYLPGTTEEAIVLSPTLAAIYAGILLGLGMLLYKTRRAAGPGAIALSLWALAAGAIVVNLGLATEMKCKKVNDIEAAVADIQKLVPPGQPLVAVGEVHPDVPFALDRVLPKTQAVDKIPAGGYFCFNCYLRTLPAFPFRWEPVAEISVDRWRNNSPKCAVVIARRL
jgi:4-amino-4-deoxy-L-arabinose transferase-like glycosyltransferase